MSTEQLDLNLFRPVVKSHEVAELVEFLRGKGWMTADAIAVAIGWNDRKVRALASESDWIISSPGRPGYKHLLDATADEYARYRNGRRSQAREMVAKVIRTDRIFYRRAAAGSF